MEEIRSSHQSRTVILNHSQLPCSASQEQDRQNIKCSRNKKGILALSSMSGANKQDEGDFHNESYQQLQEYACSFNEVIEHVNTNQIQELKKKYRYYLSKVEKLELNKKEVEESLANLDAIAENSAIVRQQKKSICFIEKISCETAEKLKELTKKVNIQKEEKKAYLHKIEELKQIVKKQKDQFFELKRMQTKMKTEIVNNQKMLKLQNAHNIFKTIMSNKNNERRKKILKGQPSFNSRLAGVSSRLNNLDLLKQDYRINKDKEEQENLAPTFPNIDSSSLKHKCRLSCLSDLTASNNAYNPMLHTDSASTHNNYSNKLARSDTFEIHSIKKIKNSKRGKSKQHIVQQLSKMMKMKEEFLAETCKLQNSAFAKMQHRVNQIFQNIPNGKTDENIGMSKRKTNQFHKCQKVSARDRLGKQCDACDRKLEQKQKQGQKYSLHQEDIAKHRIEVCQLKQNCLDEEECLLADPSTIQKLRQKSEDKQRFLQNSPEQIIKLVIESDKIQQVLGILKKYAESNSKSAVKVR